MKAQLSLVEEIRTCEWCNGAMPRDARVDAVTCSKSCRQARHRFRIKPCDLVAEVRKRFGFADPPYPGLSRKYYGKEVTFAGEVDHRELIERMLAEFPDGWALCTSAKALRAVWLQCPPETRLSIFNRGSRACVSYHARSAYEAVLIYGGRERKMEPSEVLDDVLTWGGRQHSHPDALVGMKPAPFCEWVFRQLGAQRGDELVDIFPGSGAVSRAWRIYSGQPVLVSKGDPWNPPRVLERQATKASRLEEAMKR
jgi:hypothetical protein